MSVEIICHISMKRSKGGKSKSHRLRFLVKVTLKEKDSTKQMIAVIPLVIVKVLCSKPFCLASLISATKVFKLFFFIFCILYGTILYCKCFYMKCLGWRMNHLSLLFLKGKFTLMYKCFVLHACFQDELCSQTQVLLH